MAVKTYAEQLEEVQTAIAKAEKVQAFSIKDRSSSFADLETLYKRETWLRRMATREARGGGIRARGGTPT
ncbi:hypothetical protein KAR10_06260 [bacterium]|nr:hypothetical protein [bacterium]